MIATHSYRSHSPGFIDAFFAGVGSYFVKNGLIWITLLFTLTPWIRRIIDWPLGYGRANALGFLPLLFSLAMIVLLPRIYKPARVNTCIVLATLAIFIYALVISAIAGSIVAGAYTFIDFIAPLIAVFVGTAPLPGESQAMLRKRYNRYLLFTCWLTLIISVYGIFQYIAPPAWDTAWIINSGLKSVGYPLPYQVRVFSMLNSPGTLGLFYSTAMIMVITAIKVYPVLGTVTLLAATCSSVLSLLRASWVATAVGLVVYLILSPARTRSLTALLISAIAISCTWGTIANTPELGNVSYSLQTRFDTFRDLNNDVSAIDRANEIHDGLVRAFKNPFGDGLGIYGHVTQFSSNDGETAMIDSGYLARFVELGWLGFFSYGIVLMTTLAALLINAGASLFTKRLNPQHRDLYAAGAASFAAMLVMLAFGDFNRGIGGLLPWIPVFYSFNLARPGGHQA